MNNKYNVCILMPHYSMDIQMPFTCIKISYLYSCIESNTDIYHIVQYISAHAC